MKFLEWLRTKIVNYKLQKIRETFRESDTLWGCIYFDPDSDPKSNVSPEDMQIVVDN